jgi:hypothetical protein
VLGGVMDFIYPEKADGLLVRTLIWLANKSFQRKWEKLGYFFFIFQSSLKDSALNSIL